MAFEAAESRSCASSRNCSFQATALALQLAQPTSVRSCGVTETTASVAPAVGAMSSA